MVDKNIVLEFAEKCAKYLAKTGNFVKKSDFEKVFPNSENFISFSEELNDISYMLKSDLKFFMLSDPAVDSEDEVRIAYPGYKAIVYHRIAHVLYKLDYISPIRHAKDFETYMSKRNNAKLFIAISGLSALVAGSVVALTEKPVIGVPCSKKLDGQDALLTMANMPPGVPVGTVGIDNGRNAAIVAGEILAISDEKIEENLKWIKYKNADL